VRPGARSVALEEDNLVEFKCLLGDSRARQRILTIQEEFSVEVRLTDFVSRLIWVGQDEIDPDDDYSGPRTPEVIARERRIDNALRPVIKRLFHLS